MAGRFGRSVSLGRVEALSEGHENRSQRVAVAALPLVDPKTQHIVSQERWAYACELSRLLLDLGFRVEWWQPGRGWVGELLPGVPLAGALGGDPQIFTWPQTAEGFREKSGGADYAIYFDFILAYPQAHERSIAIAHGLDWDEPLFESRLHDNELRDEWQRRQWMALSGPEKVVATDTNIIQWATTTRPGLYHKFVYIPNFVPSFTPTETDVGNRAGNTTPPDHVASDHGPMFTVLFVAPLKPSAGIAETVRAMTVLLEKHKRLQFLLAGPAAAPTIEQMTAWARATPRARYEPEMTVQDALTEADVVLFPAKSGQSTSMLCLEAMARGKPVIVGQTGGLTDLVLHGHNGIVIRPTVATIVAAVESLLSDLEKWRQMGSAAREVARSFALERWRQRWCSVILRTFR